MSGTYPSFFVPPAAPETPRDLRADQAPAPRRLTRLPRSMPVFPPRARPRDLEEEAKLKRYRREIHAELFPEPKRRQDSEAKLARKKLLAPMLSLLGAKSQRQIAREVGISDAEVRNILRGFRAPSVFTAVRMAKALGVKFSAFYSYLLTVREAPLRAPSPPQAAAPRP